MSSGAVSPPAGCAASVDPLYFNLCDLGAVWGVAVEAVAVAGAVTSFILLVFHVGIRPFVTNGQRKHMLPLQATLTVCTLGLFGLALAFITGRDFTTCAARRFVFGVLFAGCLVCLVMHGWWVTLLGSGKREVRCGVVYLGALALWLVEVVINTEWLTISLARIPPDALPPDLGVSCGVTNQDFVMALIYVMVLLLAAVLMATLSLAQKDRQWRRDGVLLLVTGVLTAAIWGAWISMYLYGNQAVGSGAWDDATLAVALVSNGWVFLVSYVIPETCILNESGAGPEDERPDGDQVVYPARSSLDYGPAQSQVHQNLYLDNAAFSMDEPSAEPEQPGAADGSYVGQLRRGVYQPTEIALISKGLTYSDFHQNTGLQMSPDSLSDDPLPSLAWPLPPTGLLQAESGNGWNKRSLP